MNRSALVTATLAATAILGACTSGAPTGPPSRAVAPSLDFSITGTRGTVGIDTATVTSDCELAPSDTTLMFRALGTYAVAYRDSECPIIR